jgi:hypothetical protein
VTLLSVLLSGCSIRPANSTVELRTTATGTATGSFELKELQQFKIGEEALAGWMGNDLVTYDRSGIYRVGYKSRAYDHFVSIGSGNSIQQPPVLSSNGKKLLYCVNTSSSAAWYIADSDKYTQSFDISLASGLAIRNFAWSPKANYIYTQSGGNYFYVFGVSDSALPIQKVRLTNLITVFDMNDLGDRYLVSLYPSGGQSPSLCIINSIGSVIQVLDENSLALKASFVGKDSVAILSGSNLEIMKTDRSRSAQYTDVRDYVLSADQNYICLLRSNFADTTDIYIGALRSGQVVNLSQIYAGYDEMPREVFFSQDDKRIAIRGTQKTVQKQGSVTLESDIKVLTFQ